VAKKTEAELQGIKPKEIQNRNLKCCGFFMLQKNRTNYAKRIIKLILLSFFSFPLYATISNLNLYHLIFKFIQIKYAFSSSDFEH
jgi:hypothetical protein